MMLDSPLVSTDWLAAHLNNPHVRVVDIRGHVLPASEPPPHYFSHRDDYDESHITGAVFVDWTSDIVEPDSPTFDVANPERFARLMGRLGIGDDTFVVAYDDANGMFAARLWWTLLYYGHEQAGILNGGWQKWRAENHPVSADVPSPQIVEFTPRPDVSQLAIAADIVSQRPPLLDVRSTDEYNGVTSRSDRFGHIPGAINVPRKTLLADDGTLKSAAELRTLFIDAGLPLDDPKTVVYCNSGVSATYGLLALRAAGLEGGRIYDSSWKEWGSADATFEIE